jgi:hypothetical protein
MLQASVMIAQAENLEPFVSHLSGVFSKEDCQRIIQTAEQVGFPVILDSVDYNRGKGKGSPSWQIDVEVEGEVFEPTLSKIYQPYLPIVNQIVWEHKKIQHIDDHAAPSMDWVFLRKYQTDDSSKPRMFSLHTDVNLFTVNIALNDDFLGGGLFYHKPDTEWELDDEDGSPELPEGLDTPEFVSQVKRQNTSSGIVFPDLHTGDLLIHNNTLHHAIAPLDRGTRYSLIFFYDEYHPSVAHLTERDVNVTLMNYWFDEPVSLLL